MTHSHAPAKVRYRLSVPTPESHLVDVEMRVPGSQRAVDLSMAAWSPGSYLIRDYARYVRHLSASTASGQACAVTKTGKQTWQVTRPASAEPADDTVVRYQVYGHDLTVRTNHIDGTHAFLHGPATYIIADALRGEPCRVDVVGPEGRDWYVATGLEPDGTGYVAANADELLDCPVHLGACQVRAFEAASAPVRLVLWGELERGGAADLDKLVADLTRIIDTHAARFGGAVPYAAYTFILMLAPRSYGGLEHRNSSANLFSPQAFASRKDYQRLLELLSHEFFHVWNGKRMAPAALSMPFDYSREAHTRCLWVMEGLTSYYDRYTVLRAGGMSARHYLERLAEEWARYLGIPGRAVHSLEEASFDAWIKLYKPDESNVNTTVSYYLKGGLVALALDLTIRAHTGGARCLDHVLAQMWQEHAETPYPEDVQPLFERAAGVDLAEFFDRYVRGREDPDLAALLARAGLVLRGTWEPAQTIDDRAPQWLGLITDKKPLRIKSVLDRSPAARAGLSPGDEIIAVDGVKVTGQADVRKRLGNRAPGDHLELALFRRDRLCRVGVTLEQAPHSRFEIASVDEPTAEQKALFAAWLGEEHPGEGTLAAAGSAHVL